MITRQQISEQLLRYMQHQISLRELVDWSEQRIVEGDFEPNAEKIVREALGKLAASDSEEFGLLWEDCEEIMRKLGYIIKIKADKAA